MAEEPADLARRVDAFADEHHLQASLRQRWHGLEPDDARAVLDLAEALRLGENHLRDFVDWAEEIVLRDQTSIAAVLAGETVRAALGRDLGRNEAIKAVRQALRRLRFPRLVAMEEDLTRRLRGLGLPSNVRVVLPPNLQDTEIRLEIRAGDAASLRAAVDSVQGAVQEIAEIFAVMNGSNGNKDERR